MKQLQVVESAEMTNWWRTYGFRRGHWRASIRWENSLLSTARSPCANSFTLPRDESYPSLRKKSEIGKVLYFSGQYRNEIGWAIFPIVFIVLIFNWNIPVLFYMNFHFCRGQSMHKVPTLFCFFAGTLPAIIRLVKVRQRTSPANSLLKHLLLELGLREKKISSRVLIWAVQQRFQFLFYILFLLYVTIKIKYLSTDWYLVISQSLAFTVESPSKGLNCTHTAAHMSCFLIERTCYNNIRAHPYRARSWSADRQSSERVCLEVVTMLSALSNFLLFWQLE